MSDMNKTTINNNSHHIIVDGVDYAYSQWSVIKRNDIDFLAVKLRNSKAINRLNNGKKDMSSDKRMYMEVFGIIGTSIFMMLMVTLYRHFFNNGTIYWPAVVIISPVALVGVVFLANVMRNDYYTATKERLFKLDPKSTRQDLDDLKHYLNDAVSSDYAAANRVIGNIIVDDNKYSHINLSSGDYAVIKDNDYRDRIKHNKYISV